MWAMGIGDVLLALAGAAAGGIGTWWTFARSSGVVWRLSANRIWNDQIRLVLTNVGSMRASSVEVDPRSFLRIVVCHSELPRQWSVGPGESFEIHVLESDSRCENPIPEAVMLTWKDQWVPRRRGGVAQTDDWKRVDAERLATDQTKRD